ncbi:MAG: META and DUF4377 domain-containing protein [Pseudoxanthomonas suwonensis]|nr:META and DUF4377 domain-containing protein [Pseudoxanthomonas suwonensis]
MPLPRPPLIATLLATCLAVSLAGCTPPPPTEADNPPARPSAASADATSAADDAGTRLQAHVWHLRGATAADGTPIRGLLDTPGRMLALRFEDRRIAVLNGCNQIGGDVDVGEDALIVGAMMSTKMACEPALMEVDRIVGELLQGQMAMSLGQGASPALTLTAGNGAVLQFEGEPTDATRYGSGGRTVFLEVAARTEPCHDPLTPNRQCLQVRELAYDEQGLRTGTAGELQPFHDIIQGFDHEPGVRNVLRVQRYDIANPPANGPATAWVLDTVVESERVDP